MPELPAAFGRYRVRRRIGEGGFGQVYLADDPVLGREVALKVPRGPWWSDDDVLAEARALARLRHPSIVQVLDAGLEGEQAYIVLECVSGDDLETHLATHRSPWLPERALAALEGPAAALDHAHAQGILHRDICPANLLLAGPVRADQVPVLKVSDFGLQALASRTGGSRTAPAGGDPRHAAPEAWRGSPDASSDVFSLASVYFRLITSRSPLAGSSAVDWIASAGLPARLRCRDLRPDIPPALDAALAAALSSRRHERPPSAVALIARLGEALHADVGRREIVGQARARILAREKGGRSACPVCLRPLSPRATTCPFCVP